MRAFALLIYIYIHVHVRLKLTSTQVQVFKADISTVMEYSRPELPAGCQSIMRQCYNVGVKERQQLVLEIAERFV